MGSRLCGEDGVGALERSLCLFLGGQDSTSDRRMQVPSGPGMWEAWLECRLPPSPQTQAQLAEGLA